MRSQPDRRAIVALAVVLTAALTAGAGAAQQQAAAPGAGRPEPAEIARARDQVKADPNLATERTIKTLHWKNATTASPPSNMFAWLRWIGTLFRWIDQSARLLMWVAAAILAGMLVVYLTRTVRWRRGRRTEEPFVGPSHVQDLDIRPESLPAHIGAAARQLWDRGDQRPALALLYRGMLSRMAHVHRLPIRESTTEGDCLALATGHLSPERRDYAARLVQVWQRFVYGGQETPAAIVYMLCDAFASSLDSPRPADTIRPGDGA